MLKSLTLLQASIFITMSIVVSSLVASQFFYIAIDDFSHYQMINLLKGLVCIAVFLFWLFIRFSKAALAQFSAFKSWQIGLLLVVQGIEGVFYFFSFELLNWNVVTLVALALCCLLYASLYASYLVHRLADLIILTAVGVGFLALIGYAIDWNSPINQSSHMLSYSLCILLCAVFSALALLKTQYKLSQFTEFEFLAILIVLVSFFELIAGTRSILLSATFALELVFIAVLINLIVKVDKHFSADWLMLTSGLNTSTDAYFTCETNGSVRFVNSAFKKLFGLEDNIPLIKIKHPLQTHPLLAKITTALQDVGTWRGETVIVGDNGNVVSVLIEFKVIEVNGYTFHQAWFFDLAEKIEWQTNNHAIQEKLERLSFNLMDKQEEERRYFAKELHDEIGQGLTLLKIQHQLPEPDKELIKSVLSELIDKVRNLSLNLRPSILDDMGLSAALVWLTDRQRQFSQLAIVSEISPNLPRFNEKFEISVFRIAQEAFTNIHKYAHADLVNISCAINDDYLQLTIEDNGIGFDVGSKINSAIKGQSLGLLSIQERSFLINGLIEISSTPEKGTVIELRVPVLDNMLDDSLEEGESYEII